MASLKNSVNCIGLTGRVSIFHDYFGYRTRGFYAISLLAQMRILQNKHVHLNLIRTANFGIDELRQIDIALQNMRRIYATVSIGVGRVQRYFIPPGFESVDEGGFHDVIDRYSVPNDGIDVFLAWSIIGTPIGWSPVGGSCDKDDKWESGVTVGVDDSDTLLGIVLAHEVGHFLSLEHDDDPNNLMYFNAVGQRLTGGQGGAMKLHCAMRNACQP